MSTRGNCCCWWPTMYNSYLQNARSLWNFHVCTFVYCKHLLLVKSRDILFISWYRAFLGLDKYWCRWRIAIAILSLKMGLCKHGPNTASNLLHTRSPQPTAINTQFKYIWTRLSNENCVQKEFCKNIYFWMIQLSGCRSALAFVVRFFTQCGSYRYNE